MESLRVALCEPVIKILLLVVGFVCPIWGAPQQILLSAGTVGTFTIPTSTYSTLTSWRMEGRNTIPTIPSDGNYYLIAGAGQYLVKVGNGVILVLDGQDGIPFNAFSVPIVAGEDFVWRLQKNTSTKVFSFEKWKVDGSNYQVGTAIMSTPVAGLSGVESIGNTAAGLGTLAFLRLYSSAVPLNSKPPFGSSGGDLGDWEFNGNGNDASGRGNNFQGLGGATYSSAAVYPPACILPAQTTFRAGTTVTGFTAGNSFPLNGGQTLTYLWQQIPNALTGLTTSVVQLSSQTAVSPTVQGLVAGSYTIQLTVTDSSGQQSTCSTKYGAVATDANGSVIISNPVHAQILGPMIANFASPWAAEPVQHIAYANLLIAKMGNPNNATCPPTVGECQFQFFDYWNQAQAGTVTVTNGSQAVTGAGTTFTTTFCQGPGSPTVPKNAGSTAIVVWYPIINPDGAFSYPSGTTGRRFGVVTSCTDDTHLTASFFTGVNNWVTDTYIGAGGGLSYAYVEQNGTGPNGIGGWLLGAYPGNYYDDVKALYAAWYRTGIDDYLYYARLLADRWFSSPAIDKGIPYETSNAGNPWGQYAISNRSLALTGLFMRNADSPPYDYSPGLRCIINYLIGQGTPNGSYTVACPTGPVGLTCGQDVREQGYALGWVALDALFDTSPAQVTLDLAAISRDMNNRWSQCQGVSSTSDGICRNVDSLGDNQTGFKSSWTSGNTAAAVTVGSSVVTGNWSAGDFLAPFIITAVTSTNPMVLTLANPAPSFWANNGTIITIGGAAGSGCSIMNGPQAVANVSTNQVTLTLNGSGCSYTASSATAATPTAIWFTSTGTTQPISNLQGDSGWYYANYVDSTHIHLVQADGMTPANYSGSRSGSVGWQLLNWATASGGGAWLGYSWQPYMTGILNQAYWWTFLALASSDATNASNAAIWAQNNANAMAIAGLNISVQSGFVTNGPYYAIGITCPGSGPGVAYYAPSCDSALLGDRELNSESLNVATIAARFNLASSADLRLGDIMMEAMYAQPGETGFDGTNILSDMVSPGFLYTATTQHKWLGAFWGVGADWAWASTRLGGLRPPISRVVQVSLDFQTASQAVLTLTRPDGTSSQVTCTTSPCPVTIDARQGDHLLSIKYLNPVNQVLLPVEQSILKAR